MSALLRSYAYRTHQGASLELNEDFVRCDFSTNAFVLVDAFGGAGVGDQAANYVGHHFLNYYAKIWDDPDSTLPYFYSSQYSIEMNSMVNSLKRIHDEVWQQNLKNRPVQRAGVSLLGLGVGDNLICTCSMGANLLLRIRGGVSTRLNTPEQDIVTEEGQPVMSIPTNALGYFEIPVFQVSEHRTEPNDRYILLSDGIHSFITDDQILTLSQNLSDNSTLIDNLFELATRYGSKDNLSAVILRF